MTTPPQPKRQWRLLAALFGTLLIAAAAGYFLLLRRDYAVLYQDLREDDAAAAVRVLDAQGVNYRLANGGADILVPAADLDAIRLDMAGSDLTINGLEGFELFDQSEMGLTDFAQRIKYQRALQGELARTVMRMDGVVEARVHITMPERTLFRSERRSAEAAVTVVTRRAQDLTPARVEGIRRLVAAAVADLAPSDVVVLDGRGEPILTVSTEIDAPPAPFDPIAEIDALARGAVRAAIPYRRFLLTVQEAAADLDGAIDDADASASNISIVTEASLTHDERIRIGNELARVGLVGAGDMAPLTFAVGPVERAPPSAPAEPQPAEAQRLTVDGQSPHPRQNFALLSAAGAAAVLALLLAAFLLLRPRLSKVEQATFAERLQLTLAADAKGAGDGL